MDSASTRSAQTTKPSLIQNAEITPLTLSLSKGACLKWTALRQAQREQLIGTNDHRNYHSNRTTEQKAINL